MERYELGSDEVKNSDGRRVYSSIRYGKPPLQDTDIYIYSKGSDRLDTLAYRYYGDVRFWIFIALANNIGKGTLIIPSGIRLRVPYPLTQRDATEQIKSANEKE
jgi:phage tail protein X